MKGLNPRQMKIKLDDIPEEGLSLDVIAEGKDLEAIAGGLDFSIPAPVSAHLDVMLTEGRVMVKGQMSARAVFSCARCLKIFERPLDSEISLFFVRGKGAVQSREHELTGDDLEVNYLEGPELDTDEILLSQIALEAPMQPLCAEDCKGLCPACGADLNAGPCGCKIVQEKVDARLAALKGFKVK